MSRDDATGTSDGGTPAPAAAPERLASVLARLRRREPPPEPDEAARYEEAIRRAFLSPGPLAPATLGRRVAREPAQPEEVAPEQGSTAAEAATEPITAAAEPVAVEAEPVAVGPGVGEAVPRLDVVAPVPDPDQPIDATPKAAAAFMLVAASTESSPPEPSAASLARQAGPTAPADLLEVPGSVTAAADDFFDGLVRRVPRRR
jgi:hypothetical protein